MSCWSKIAVAIKNPELFAQCCEKHNVSFEIVDKAKQLMQQGMPVYGILRDKTGAKSHHSEAYLCTKANDYRLVIDNDPNWCSITQRLGPNGGLLMQTYTKETIREGLRRQGGSVISERKEKDGSLLLRVMAP